MNAIFNDSLVRNWDKNEELLEVYHGTNINFKNFNKKYLGIETGHITSKLGFWFSTEKEIIKEKYDIIKICYLNITKYIDMSLNDLLLMDEEELKNDRKEWIKQGYNGIRVFDTEFGGYSWIPFDTKQIKIVGNIIK